MTTDDRVNEFISEVNRGRLAALLSRIEAADLDYPVRYGLVLDALALAHRLDYPAGIGWDDQNAEAVRNGCQVVVYIELPTGQISWHMPAYTTDWDGHTTEEKYRRCNAFAASLAPREEASKP